jgi:hypothetical protein
VEAYDAYDAKRREEKAQRETEKENIQQINNKEL